MKLYLFLVLVFISTCSQGQMLQGIAAVSSIGAGGIITPGVHLCAGSTTGADVTSGAIDTSGASLLVMFVASYDIVALPTISDSKGNAWHQRSSYFNTGINFSRSTFYYAQNPTVGSGHTFTATGPGFNDYPLICIIAFSGTATSTVYDTENGNIGDVGLATIQPGSVTPNQSNEVVITGVSTINTGTVSIDNGFTITDQETNVPTQHFGGGIAYKIQTTAAAVNPTWTFGEMVDASSSVATFKAP